MISLDYVSEMQKTIVESPAKLKLINGCAGSRKTDTLIKAGIYNLLQHQSNLLFLTLVGSVTDEIKTRIQNYLKIEIKKSYQSNHYLGTYQGNYIEIANYDAWIHKQLEMLKCDLTEIGDNYHEKNNRLQELITTEKCGIFCMKNNKIANCILIDEFQDIEPLKVKLLIKIYQNNPNNYIFCVGDYLQSIFDNAITDDSHPINLFKTINPEYFIIDTCYRCPLAHLNFCNLIMREYQLKYNLGIINGINDNITDKPLLFTHQSFNNNFTGFTVTRQIVEMIKVLMDNDTSITPSDIAIVMARTNNNPIFEQLKKQLRSYYATRRWNNHIKHFKTKFESHRKSIDYNEAINKTVLISIHGFKGKDRKVIFLIGFSNCSIPKENNMYTAKELIDQSLVNVSLTRSTKYLFVGFTYNYPSIYLANQKNELETTCYCSWKHDQIDNSIYKMIALKSNEILLQYQRIIQPTFNVKYRQQQICKPNIYKITDIADNLHVPVDLTTTTNVSFGENVYIRTKLNDDIYQFIGIIGELMIIRKKYKYIIIDILNKFVDANIYYTNDECLLNLSFDYKLNNLFEVDTKNDNYVKTICVIQAVLSYYLDRNVKLRDILSYLKDNPAIILNSVFSTDTFRNDLQLFISNIENEEIDSRIWWNMSLFWNDIFQEIRQPMIYIYLNYFTENLLPLHSNIDKLLDYLQPSNKIEYQLIHNLLYTIKDHDILDNLGFDKKLDVIHYKNGYTYGITGRSDIYDVINKTLIEIKVSNKSGMQREWLMQTLLYYLLNPHPDYQPQRMVIANVRAGILYDCQINGDKMELLKKIIINIYNNSLLSDFLISILNST